MSSAEIATVTEPITGVLATVADEYTREKIELVKQTVAQGATDAELAMFLGLAARYGLDPFAKEIWCAPMDGQRLQIFTSRDGYLAIANRHPQFAGLVSEAVWPGDVFERVTDSTGMPVGIRHEYAIDRRSGGATGKPIGAYALVYRHDRVVPTFFFARWSEYGASRASNTRSAWAKHPSAMIIKVAESNALRRAFSISGLVGEDEAGDDEPAGERPSYVRHLAGLGRGAGMRRELDGAAVGVAAPLANGDAADAEREVALPSAASPTESSSVEPPPDDSDEPSALPAAEDTRGAGEDDATLSDAPTLAARSDQEGVADLFPGPVTDTRPISERQRKDIYQLIDEQGDHVVARGDVAVLVAYATRNDAVPTKNLADCSRTRFDQLLTALRGSERDRLIREAIQWRRDATQTAPSAAAAQGTLA